MSIVDLFVKHFNDTEKIEFIIAAICNIFWYGLYIIVFFIGTVLILGVIFGISLLVVSVGRKIFNKIVD